MHRGSKGCNWDFGICRVRGPGDCSPPAGKAACELSEEAFKDGWVIGNLALEGDKMVIEFQTPLREKEDVLPIDEDIET